jgi:hypothetical protein
MSWTDFDREWDRGERRVPQAVPRFPGLFEFSLG